MLTLARPACINQGFILHQQAVQHMKSLMLANPIPLSALSDLASLLLCQSCHTFLPRQSRLLSEPEWKYDTYSTRIQKLRDALERNWSASVNKLCFKNKGFCSQGCTFYTEPWHEQLLPKDLPHTFGPHPSSSVGLSSQLSILQPTSRQLALQCCTLGSWSLVLEQ